jgi:hypothetical protein
LLRCIIFLAACRSWVKTGLAHQRPDVCFRRVRTSSARGVWAAGECSRLQLNSLRSGCCHRAIHGALESAARCPNRCPKLSIMLGTHEKAPTKRRGCQYVGCQYAVRIHNGQVRFYRAPLDASVS